MAQEDQVFLLTQEAYDKMQEELKWREGEYRDEIIAKVSAARAEGDLSARTAVIMPLARLSASTRAASRN